MIRFKVFQNGAPARSVDLDGAHLLGNDRVPLRAEIRFSGGQIICEPRSRQAAALAIAWNVPGLGRMMLETPRLLERPEPYNLHVELARGQLMRISLKREDWGLYDNSGGSDIYRQIDAARDLLLEAMAAPDDAASARQGEAALALAVRVGEELGIFSAEQTLGRRRALNPLPRRPLGCRLAPGQCSEGAVQRLAEAVDYAMVPFPWRLLEPREGTHHPAPLEQCLHLLKAHKVGIWASSLLSLDRQHLPDWLGRRVKDYEQLRELIARHLKCVCRALGGHIDACEVAVGLNAYNAFKLPFEHIMELTRLSAVLVKQALPRVETTLTIALPWGEYYASDPQTVPPMLYAEMVVQNGVCFDAFGLELRFSCGESTPFVRDLMQVSAMLDRLGSLGKPVHITAAGVPSSGPTPKDFSWHGPWSPDVQAQWLKDFYRIAFSKSFVETVCWHGLIDELGCSGGLLDSNLHPKPAYAALQRFRKELVG